MTEYSYILIPLLNCYFSNQLAEKLEKSSLTLTPPLPLPTKGAIESHAAASEKRHAAAAASTVRAVSSATKTTLDFPLPLASGEFSSPVGLSMRKRLESSMLDFEIAKKNAEGDKRTVALRSGTSAAKALASVWQNCVEEIVFQRDLIAAEFAALEAGLNAVEIEALAEDGNRTPSGVGGFEGIQRYMLAKAAQLEPHVSLALLLGSTMAARGVEQLRRAAPLITARTAQRLIDRATLMLLRVNRYCQLLRCGSAAKAALAKGGDAGIAKLRGFVGQLSGQRHYVTLGGSDAAPTLTFDPRFVFFEFSTTFILWKRQMMLVQQFAGEALQRGSQAQQMIMGDGKTTVVGPLLSLILAAKPHASAPDHSLQSVTLVCPGALLAQSKSVMRALFSSPAAPKPVYTLQFERSFDSRVSVLSRLVGKLELARQQRGVVIASPTAIKSVLLKYVEVSFRVLFFILAYD